MIGMREEMYVIDTVPNATMGCPVSLPAPITGAKNDTEMMTNRPNSSISLLPELSFTLLLCADRRIVSTHEVLRQGYRIMHRSLPLSEA
jgi:hypothetical protein